ncbi:MAG: hypothetical protein K9G26_05275 [Emcibacter sp.]|nr:hypothetical protein [Emcibacter sp.]
MTKKALLITGQESETISILAKNLIPVAGMSIFARQMKQMKAIGVDEMHVVTDWFVPDFEKEIKNCSSRPANIFIHSTKDAPLKLLEHNNEGNQWLLIEEGVILDERIIRLIDHHSSPTVLSFIGHNDFLEERTAKAIVLHLETQQGFFGSIAKLSSQTLAANVRKLNSLEGLPHALHAISRANDCIIVNVTEIPLYVPENRRNVDLVWLPITRRDEGDKGTKILLSHAHKDILDWPAKYIHSPLEDFIIKYLCKFPIIPPYIIIANGILSLLIIYLFWNGFMIPALVGAYLALILSGVETKLAYLKMFQSKTEQLKPLIDKTLEYCWYIAIAAYLSNLYGLLPLIIATTLILFNLADIIQSEFFRRMTNTEICNTDPFDRKFEIIAGGRNTYMWSLLPFALYNQWVVGLLFIGIYGIITFFVHQIRVVYHLKNIMIENSELFAKNFKKTKIL